VNPIYDKACTDVVGEHPMLEQKRFFLSFLFIRIKLLIACLKQSNQIISLGLLQHISSRLPRPE